MLNKFKLRAGYKTASGAIYGGSAGDILRTGMIAKLRGQVQLILTSPPFPLNHKKKYGNLKGEQYIKWLSDFAVLFTEYLKPNGSIVIEMGNAWEPAEPTMSTLAIEALLAFRKAAGLKLCQQFICNNPAKLPTPAQWVNVERIRVKDSFTHIWWMAPDIKPKADNRRVLKPYSKSMLNLLKSQDYNSGRRPSEHHIGKRSFLKDNKGAIPGSVLNLTNTQSESPYLRYCRANGYVIHPARMPSGLAEFFINFLTDPGDFVLDPFAGSNTTGAAAEDLGRRWLSIELREDYILGSRGRFKRYSKER